MLTLTQNDLKSLITAYEIGVRVAVNAAKKIALPRPTILSFGTLNLYEESIVTLAKKVVTGKRREDKGSEFLYIFMLSEGNAVTTRQVLNAFSTAKKLQGQDIYQGKKNLCQGNDNHLSTRTLYVGRSYSPRERLKQHLRNSNGGTYAMHMAMWAGKFDLKLDFFLYQFKGQGDRVIQVIEDGLWDHLKPLLGKRGER